MLQFSKKTLLLAALVGLATVACKKKENDVPGPTVYVPYTIAEPAFRPSMSVDGFSATTPYNTTATQTFVDDNGDSTVNRTSGRIRLAMFKALDAYTKKGTSQAVSETTLNNMFNNAGSPFANTALDGSGLNIKGRTGLSANTATVWAKIESYFPIIAEASNSYNVAASEEDGTAGILSFTNPTSGNVSKYLVDARGIEYAQVISKSLIGSFQLDYIGNTLLADLNADNSELVTGEKYTQLEHNWDEAYGLLTINDNYCLGSTDDVRSAGESFLGSYVWEYNKPAYPKLHEAFLRGRAAIVNNDMVELKKQSDYIRTQFELAVAKAAVGYMAKASDVSKTTAERAHAFGEGFGFVYALRFCTLSGADAAFSEEVSTTLLPNDNATFYEITAVDFTSASNKIKAKFNL